MASPPPYAPPYAPPEWKNPFSTTEQDAESFVSYYVDNWRAKARRLRAMGFAGRVYSGPPMGGFSSGTATSAGETGAKLTDAKGDHVFIPYHEDGPQSPALQQLKNRLDVLMRTPWYSDYGEESLAKIAAYLDGELERTAFYDTRGSEASGPLNIHEKVRSGIQHPAPPYYVLPFPPTAFSHIPV